jgi:hypothetical protein
MARDPNKVREVTVNAAGNKTEAMTVTHYYNLSLEFIGAATIALQRSFDGGAHWKTISTYTGSVESVDYEPEEGVQYRLVCTAFTSGPILCRLSQ